MPELLYKPLARGGRPAFGGRGRYALPTADHPGTWLPDLGWVVPRQRGYHLCTADALWPWLHEELYAAEGRGAYVTVGGTRVYAGIRLLCRLRWSREDALLLFDEQLAELRVVALNGRVAMPRPFIYTDAEWSHLRDHIALTTRWYRAFISVVERAGVARCALSCRGAASGAQPSTSRLAQAERHIRACFFVHVHGRSDTPIRATADSIAAESYVERLSSPPSTPFSATAATAEEERETIRPVSLHMNGE